MKALHRFCFLAAALLLSLGLEGAAPPPTDPHTDLRAQAEAKTKAGEIVATGEKFRAETMDQAKIEAAAERDRIIAAAKAEAQQEYQAAREQLRNQVADLAVAGAARILKREIRAADHAELLASIRQEL